LLRAKVFLLREGASIAERQEVSWQDVEERNKSYSPRSTTTLKWELEDEPGHSKGLGSLRGSGLLPVRLTCLESYMLRIGANAAIPATTGFVIEFLPVKSERGEDGGAQDQKIDQSRDNNIAVGEAAKST
jgi:hypothetical protein